MTPAPGARIAGGPPVVLASTNRLALQVVPWEALTELAVDVPPDLSSLR